MKILDDIIEATLKQHDAGRWIEDAYRRGWVEDREGNFCLLVPGEAAKDVPASVSPIARGLLSPVPDLAGQYYVVKASGTWMGDVPKKPLETTCLVRVNEDGSGCYVLYDNTGRDPTSELSSHLVALQARHQLGHDAEASVHYHPAEIMALTNRPEFLDGDVDDFNARVMRVYEEPREYIREGGMGFIPPGVPRGAAREQKNAEMFSRYRAVVWARHGVIACEKDLQAAHGLAAVANKFARIYLLAPLGPVTSALSSRPSEK